MFEGVAGPYASFWPGPFFRAYPGIPGSERWPIASPRMQWLRGLPSNASAEIQGLPFPFMRITPIPFLRDFPGVPGMERSSSALVGAPSRSVPPSIQTLPFNPVGTARPRRLLCPAISSPSSLGVSTARAAAPSPRGPPAPATSAAPSQRRESASGILGITSSTPGYAFVLCFL